MDWKIIILFLIITFNSYSQKMEDYTIFKDFEGAYRDVRAGDTPYGPPNCLCLFRKENSIAPTCETMHFPLG